MTPPHRLSDLEIEGLFVTLDAHVATLEFSRPPSNFFDIPLIVGLAQALEALATDHDCRAVVLKSTGRHFCAGANFAAPVASIDGTDVPDGPHLYDVAARLFDQPLPIVAIVQGAAIGGGLGLALAADFRVVAPEARFSANFAQLGFHHGFAMTVTLPAVVGQQNALDLLFSGRRIDGEEAARVGLADRLAPLESLESTAIEMAHAIASSAPLAVRSIRQTMRGDLAARARVAMEREQVEQARLMMTADWQEGIAAMGDRRKPQFHAR